MVPPHWSADFSYCPVNGHGLVRFRSPTLFLTPGVMMDYHLGEKEGTRKNGGRGCVGCLLRSCSSALCMTHYWLAAKLLSMPADGYEERGHTFFHKLPADLITCLTFTWQMQEYSAWWLLTAWLLPGLFLCSMFYTWALGYVTINANVIFTVYCEDNPLMFLSSSIGYCQAYSLHHGFSFNKNL